MTTLARIIAGMERADGGLRASIPPDWMQGRTAYGGLSSALALAAAQASEPDLPPLRSATVAFVGPLAGTVTVAARTLRRGRNAAYVEASVTSGGNLGLRATFVFMAAVPSTIAHDRLPPAPHAPPPPGTPLYRGPADHFTGRLEFHDRKADAAEAGWLRWVRLAERDGLDDEVALIAVADALPPAALRLHKGFGPVSSLTWMVNLLAPRPVTTDGWWLIDTRTDRALDGYSSQRMTMWNAAGVPVADAMQGVAVFV